MSKQHKSSWYTELKNWCKPPEPACAPIEIEGHVFPATATVGDETLMLNGAGIRSVNSKPLYAAALYLPQLTQRADTAEALLGARRVVLYILRDVRPSDYVDSLRDGIIRNTNETSQAFIQEERHEVEKVMMENSPLYKGDVIDYDWIPGVGSFIYRNGKKISGKIRGKAIYDAVLSIWLGSESIEEDLRKSLLRA
ncbi:MAG: chalcone isomerase family protein [Burkholderiales bacterium]|nr:chalcone isomerase family protein [Burkholderiales bacterium]